MPDKNVQCHWDLFLIPKGCLIIAQLFKVGSLGKRGPSPEGTTDIAPSVGRPSGNLLTSRAYS